MKHLIEALTNPPEIIYLIVDQKNDGIFNEENIYGGFVDRQVANKYGNNTVIVELYNMCDWDVGSTGYIIVEPFDVDDADFECYDEEEDAQESEILNENPEAYFKKIKIQ